ncbi:cytochrome P450 [Embleya hyalina]|uniref:Cytochrome P450 n=1 Tax=Embleya hyalina TaxID=516124 RepID=A0A401YQX7_9ACTN|nr:cytochrome P450 [Embleya hyalina]GCD96977.1 cytochrome P450 [Embleya hyalina]
MSASASSPPARDEALPSLVELYQPRHARDPYALYRRLREAGPVHWDRALQAWTVMGHADIRRLSRHPHLSEDRVSAYRARLPPDRRRLLAPLADPLSRMMLFHEPPEHTRLRAPLREPLGRRAVGPWRAVVRERLHELLDRLPEGPVDLLRDLADPLTATMIAELLGVPASHRRLLNDWSSLLDEFFGQSTRELPRVEALRTLFESMRGGGAKGAGRPVGGSFPNLFADGSGDLTADESFAAFLLLVDAGQATTTHFLANAVRALLEHPDQLALVRDRPGLLPGAVAELLRYDGPVQFVARTVRADFDYLDTRFRAGQTVLLVLGSGNRDPLVHADPDRLDVTRRVTDHLAFGHGAHYCLGAALALSESEIFLEVLLDRAPGIRGAWDTLAWKPTVNFRFLTALPVELGTAGVT